jgi:hypothetical protein
MSTLAAALQILIALAFVTIPLVRHRYGPAAKASAEAELSRQGVPPTVLAENGLRFDAGGHETIVPATVAAVLLALAALNLTDGPGAQLLTWIFQSVILVGNALILHSQLTAAQSVTKAFARKNDPVLARIDVQAFLTAAERGFPRWVFPVLQNVRHTVVIAGSLLALLAVTLAG